MNIEVVLPLIGSVLPRFPTVCRQEAPLSPQSFPSQTMFFHLQTMKSHGTSLDEPDGTVKNIEAGFGKQASHPA